jgi:hypothetical protein
MQVSECVLEVVFSRGKNGTAERAFLDAQLADLEICIGAF